MTRLRLLAALTVLTPSALSAGPYDGLYLPPNSTWACDPQNVGMDGGPLAIENGNIFGVESACQLRNPKSEGAGTRFTAVCSAEGDEYSKDIVITPSGNGLRIENYGWNSDWVRCGDTKGMSASSVAIPSPSNSVWDYSGQMGQSWAFTEDGRGNGVTFICNLNTNKASVQIRLGGSGISTGAVEIDIDGQVFQMSVAANDGMGLIDLDCPRCSDTYFELWSATAAGNLMTVRSSDGRSAKFNLTGSRRALGSDPCLQ